jgi:hypothetical protein
MSQTNQNVRAIVAVADAVRSDGNAFSGEALRDVAAKYQGIGTMRFLEATGELIYEGPAPAPRET